MPIVENSEADILTRAIDPTKPDLSIEAAESISAIDFAPEDHARMRELTTKAQEGSLTASERSILDNYERVNDLLGILRSKARRSLKRAGKQS